VPPTANHAGDSDPDIDELITVTDVPTSGRPEIAVSNSFGFGGHNAVVVVGR
jgi:3-oxoacyl-[acyl-carrier-protein] synthase II